MMGMRIVVALGGNALLKRGEPMTAVQQRINVRHAAKSLAELIEAGHQIIVTHGNGPQVGLLALQAAAGPPDGVHPLDLLGAQTEGMIGYLIEQELGNLLPDSAMIATLLTQVRVDARDPAFRNPTKPIGATVDQLTAEHTTAHRGWTFAPEGHGWRRVVPSPAPLEVFELRVIKMLVERGVVVICTGGGGIPVVARKDGSLIGVEAVIDKDRASGLLAHELDADMLLLLTDVDAVYVGFGNPDARRIASVGAHTLSPGDFAKGSMGPKIEAAKLFANSKGRKAAIGRLEDAMAILAGVSGTIVQPGNEPASFRNAAKMPA
jgi:carbamate kinase